MATSTSPYEAQMDAGSLRPDRKSKFDPQGVRGGGLTLNVHPQCPHD